MLRKRAPTVATPRNFGAGHSCHSASWRPWALLAPPRHDFPHQHPQHKRTLPCGPPFTPVHSGPEQPLLWGQPSDCPPPSPSPCASPGLGVCGAPTPRMSSSPSQQHPLSLRPSSAQLTPPDPHAQASLPAALPPVPGYTDSMASPTRERRPQRSVSHSWAPGPSCQFHLP